MIENNAKFVEWLHLGEAVRSGAVRLHVPQPVALAGWLTWQFVRDESEEVLFGGTWMRRWNGAGMAGLSTRVQFLAI